MIWVLTGFMGCGKTSIGRLAASLSAGLEFIDLDEEIERREGRSIPDIFSADGETVFRSIERHTLADLLHAAGVPPEGRNTRGSIAGGPSRREGGVSEANSRRGSTQPQDLPTEVREVKTFYETMFLEMGLPITYMEFKPFKEGPYVNPRDPEDFDSKHWRELEGTRRSFGHQN